MATKRDPRLRLYIRLDKNYQVVPGSDVLRMQKPKSSQGYWVDITDCLVNCCTTTTTTSSTSTTTTTTTAH